MKTRLIAMSAVGLVSILQAGAAAAQTTTPTSPSPAAPNRGNSPPPIYIPALPSGSGMSNVIRTGDERVAIAYYSALSLTSCAFTQPAAEHVLSTPIGSTQEEKAVSRFLRSNLRCATSSGGVPMPLMRGAMAEWLVKRGGMSPTAKSRPGAVVFDPAANKSLIAATEVALCQVGSQAATARKVLDSQPGSAGELQAETALFAATPSCAGVTRPAGLDPVIFRGLLAIALASGQAGRS